MGNTQGFSDEFNQQPQRNKNVPPPASNRAILSLPQVQVTADDLLEETNKECAICLMDQIIGKNACKLPCGHLYHRECITGWLEKQCTCPACRFELETDDPEYEKTRLKRMKIRKLRMRLDELKSKSISQLKQICTELSINIINCIDKQSIIDAMVSSGKINITEGVPAIELSEEEFKSKSVSELKHLLLSFGLSVDGALEKTDLRKRLIDSERVILVASSPIKVPTNSPFDSNENIQSLEEDPIEYPSNVLETEIPCLSENSSNDFFDKSQFTPLNNDPARHQIPSSPVHSTQRQETLEFSFSPSQLRALPLSLLRDICHQLHIDTTTCLEKSDVVHQIITSNKILIIPDQES